MPHDLTCSNCGAQAAAEVTVTDTFAYRRRRFQADILVTRCSECGHEGISREQALRNDVSIEQARIAACDALSPADIAQIRSKLRITQAEAGSILGGGATAFAKYEAGTVVPSKPMDVLLRLLDRIPALLHVVCNLHATPPPGFVALEPNQGVATGWVEAYATIVLKDEPAEFEPEMLNPRPGTWEQPPLDIVATQPVGTTLKPKWLN